VYTELLYLTGVRAKSSCATGVARVGGGTQRSTALLHLLHVSTLETFLQACQALPLYLKQVIDQPSSAARVTVSLFFSLSFSPWSLQASSLKPYLSSALPRDGERRGEGEGEGEKAG
jgi:hypothetical protein